VTKQGFLSNTFGTLFGAQDVAVGDAAFDPAYVVKADEPPRAQRLLDSELRRFLVDLAANDAGMRLGDAGGYMERRGAISDEASIEWLLRTVALAARRMHEARQSVPPAAALAPHRAAWMEYARAAGMTGMDTPLCIWGRMSEDAAVSAYAVRVGEGQHRLEVLVRFDAPLGLGLLVRPTKTLDGIASFFGGQDHSLGDAAFDRAFVVKAPSADRLARILDAEVRKGLVELAAHAIAVQVQDEGVTVRAASFPADPAEVPRLVAQVRGVARSIQVNATRHEGAGIGPYR